MNTLRLSSNKWCLVQGVIREITENMADALADMDWETQQFVFNHYCKLKDDDFLVMTDPEDLNDIPMVLQDDYLMDITDAMHDKDFDSETEDDCSSGSPNDVCPDFSLIWPKPDEEPHPLEPQQSVCDDFKVVKNDLKKYIGKIKRKRLRSAASENSVLPPLKTNPMPKAKITKWLRNILDSPDHNPKVLEWEEKMGGKSDGVFRINDQNELVALWAHAKDNPNMSYDSLR